MKNRCPCPYCGHERELPDSMLGERVGCPSCGRDYTADLPEVVSASPPEITAGLPRVPTTRAPRRERDRYEPFAPDRLWDDNYRERRRPVSRFAPNDGWALLAMIGLAACLAVEVGGLALGIYRFWLLKQGVSLASAQMENLDLAYGFAGMAEIATAIGTAVCFCVWFFRAHQNLPALGSEGMQYSPGWAIGGFFVPILNLIRPYQVALEIWKASDPGAPLSDPHRWKSMEGSALVSAWWFVWLIARVLGMVSMMAFPADPTGKGVEEAARTGTGVLLLSHVLTAAAAGLAIMMIQQIQQRQQDKAERLAAALERDLEAVAHPV